MDSKQKCKYCGSTHTRKNGYTDTGKRRYLCLESDCGKSFVDDDGRSSGQFFEEVCKICGQKQVFTKFGFNFSGNQRLKGTVCKHTMSIGQKKE